MKYQEVHQHEETIAPRLLASLIIFLLYCLLIGGAVGYLVYSAKAQLEKEIQSHQGQIGRLIGEWIIGSFEITDYLLRDILGHVKASDLVYQNTNPVERKRLNDLLIDRMRSVDNVILVGLFDKNCTITHSNRISPGKNFSDWEYCAALRDNPQKVRHVTNGIVSVTGPLNVAQSRRFLPDVPGFHGFAAVGVDLGFFARWLEKLDTGRTGFVAILDSRKMLLGRKPVIAEALGRTVDATDLEAFIASDNTTTTLISTSPVDGVERYVFYQKVRGLPFIVVVGAGVSESLAGWYQQFATAAVGTVMLWLMALYVLRKYQQGLRQNQALAEAANFDPLTRLISRRHFTELAEREILRARRLGKSVGLVLLDLDHFKSINNTYGHAIGDRALVAFAETCRNTLRDIDIVARLGGDEFVALLPDTSGSDLVQLAERVRLKVCETCVLNDHGQPVNLTTSIGIVCGSGEALPELEELMRRADASLYKAKDAGRNVVGVIDR